MKYAQVVNGIVVNTIEADAPDFLPNLVPAQATEVGIGWTFDGDSFVPPPEPPPPVPASVNKRQAYTALLKSGLLSQVEEAIANIPGEAGDLARIEWATSGTFERHRPLLLTIASELGLTDAQVDDLFRLAAAQ